ncbi:hypothetical protein C8D95_10111 [Silicimonas algicola]|uniref:Uncharacterized protein n=1 Tax=Silicimonas algicola TaxID=1826607 RepID=A0A316GE47_9RHOB|nr:hypothetical protein C8D95_10111 [Silicimonas algicola]
MVMSGLTDEFPRITHAEARRDIKHSLGSTEWMQKS